MIGFAHRGAPTNRADDNTLPAFQHALDLGADGLESDIALTSDDVPVLVHPRPFSRKVRVSRMRRSELPDSIPTLEDLYDACGTDFHLSLDMGQPRAVDAVVRIAAERGALDRLWLTYWRLPTLEAWRMKWQHVHLVFPVIPVWGRSASRLVPRLRSLRVDVLNVHHRFLSQRLVDQAHAAGIDVFAWGIRRDRQLSRAAAMNVDGVFCDNVDAMVRLMSPFRTLVP